MPWALERRRDPTPQEPARGVAYLKEFLALLTQPRAVVALGRVRSRHAFLAGLHAVKRSESKGLAVAPQGEART